MFVTRQWSNLRHPDDIKTYHDSDDEDSDDDNDFEGKDNYVDRASGKVNGNSSGDFKMSDRAYKQLQTKLEFFQYKFEKQKDINQIQTEKNKELEVQFDQLQTEFLALNRYVISMS